MKIKYFFILLLINSYILIDCLDNLKCKVLSDFDFKKFELTQKLTPAELDYLMQISCDWGNESAFIFFASHGAVPKKEFFGRAIKSFKPRARIVEEILKQGLYQEYIEGTPTLDLANSQMTYFMNLSARYPDLSRQNTTESRNIVAMLVRYNRQSDLRKAWIAIISGDSQR